MDYLLLETGDYILQETGDKIILQEGSSESPSPSVSESASISSSPSVSLSASPSASWSPSLSESPSPSEGYGISSRGDEASLPDSDNDLETSYSEEEETKILTRDNIYVGQTGILQYMIHQFKFKVGYQTFCQIECEARSSLSPSESTVYLEVFNQVTSKWEIVDTNTGYYLDTNFELFGKIPDVTDYVKDNVISCRVWQVATE